ncbi:hypothetical protein G8E05_04970 [Clostridium botulinum]|uniref:aminoacyl--tRNA ligase-related protein n=1 Tax=Clostridium botulinum TaxID=1491 RepID=UPI000585C9CE|nr:aminoacyl--tRNA ligase-related protein [Clostridium botulinum]AJD26792.1 tRNA synthetase class II core domain family protein [Clostridium botulinum CDC_297]MBY6889920.1 hypothetical protein [Clostridium botulinum]MBY6893422.1 hypothetical protein [Clostridium botulinum]MBY6900631.1 hypothetical protein [Clostridium botulinum]UOJ20410.1 hypothetical protein G8E05_04970 [Clostridium botulinum]
MFKYSIKNLREEDKNFFKDMIPYLSQYIIKYEMQEGDVFIYCDVDNENQIRNCLDHLINMINKNILSEKTEKIKTIEDYTSYTTINHSNIYNKLVNRDDVRELAKGSFAYSGLFLDIYEYFERKIDEFACSKFKNIRKIVYPDLHSIEDYIKGRYFENFPHYMMFQTTLKNDMSVYEKFSKCKFDYKSILDEIKTPQNVLRHAACVPVYSLLENEMLDAEEVQSFIVSGKCFRNEEDNIFELSRLNEFYMKEFVFVGDENAVNKMIEISKELTKFWVDIFKLNSKYETANDSFFANNYKKMKFFQIIGESKQEFKAFIPGNKNYIAASSINYHRTHFSKAYNIIDEKGNYCYSACFAFGIERLAYALLSQKGLNIDKWDFETIKEIEKYSKLRSNEK